MDDIKKSYLKDTLERDIAIYGVGGIIKHVYQKQECLSPSRYCLNCPYSSSYSPTTCSCLAGAKLYYGVKTDRAYRLFQQVLTLYEVNPLVYNLKSIRKELSK